MCESTTPDDAPQSALYAGDEKVGGPVKSHGETRPVDVLIPSCGRRFSADPEHVNCDINAGRQRKHGDYLSESIKSSSSSRSSELYGR